MQKDVFSNGVGKTLQGQRRFFFIQQRGQVTVGGGIAPLPVTHPRPSFRATGLRTIASMPATVSLREIVDHLSFTLDEYLTYLNKETGVVVTVSKEELAYAERNRD